jgi:predicted transposase YbfD/YdcC
LGTSARSYIGSKVYNTEVFNGNIRQHCAIDNNLHWSLDVNFQEDSFKKRKGHSAANFGLFTKIALTLLEK